MVPERGRKAASFGGPSRQGLPGGRRWSRPLRRLSGLTLVTLAVVAGCGDPEPSARPSFAPPPQIDRSSGAAAPTFRLPAMDGSMHGVDADASVPTMLIFWATWCGPCREEMPQLEKLQRRFGDDLRILAVSIDEDRGALQRFVDEERPAFTVLHDSRQAIKREYGVTVTPTAFIIGTDGQVLDRVEGAHNWESQDVRTTLEQLTRAS